MICPFCNQNLPEGALFCGFCGNKLADAAQPADEVQPTDEALQAADELHQTTNEVQQMVNEAPTESVEAAAENAAQNIESTVSALADNAAAPEEASAAVAMAENVIPDMPDTVQNVSAVNLNKNESASAPGGTPAPENDFVGQVRDGLQNVASSVQNDTQEAVTAVKNGNFKALLKNKTFIICCAAIIAVIFLVVIIAVCIAAAGSGYEVKGAYYRVEDGGDAVYLYNGSVVKGVGMTDASGILATSLDGTAAVVEDGDELYLFNGTKATRITDDFDTGSASISANGKAVSYVSDDSVFIYTGGKRRKIADIEEDYHCRPVISPNGKVVAFSDKDDDDIKTYVWKGGNKAIDLDSDIIPVSVSDGGKMIFGTDESGKLCYIRNMKKNGEEKIDSFSEIEGISFDHNKLIYISDGDTYCFDTSLNKNEGVEIDNGSISLHSDFSYQDNISYINSFKRFYGEKNGNLYMFFRRGKDYDDEKLVSDIGNPLFSKDNKSFVYIDDGDVMKGTLSNAKNAKKIAKDAVSVRANDSLTNVFYCDEDMTLRYAVKGKKIASDVKRYVVTESGICVFSDTDGDLFYSSKGREKKKAGLDEISSLAIRNNVLYVVSDGELYTSTNGKSFRKAGVDVG